MLAHTAVPVACLEVVEVPLSAAVLSILSALQLTCPPAAHRDELQALHTCCCLLEVVELLCSLQVSIFSALQLTCPPVAHRDELQALRTGRCKLPAL